MRFVYGVIAAVAWSALVSAATANGVKISNNTEWVTLAIIVAGAMSGGD